MRARWRDGVHLVYGGNGHRATQNSKKTNYLYPGDPAASNQWSETALKDTVGDRRGVGTIGPVTLNSGESKCIDIAYIYARDLSKKGNNITSVTLLKKDIPIIQNFYNNNINSDCLDYLSVPEIQRKENKVLNLYPNPANNSITIDIINASKNGSYAIYDILGNEISGRLIYSYPDRVDISNLNKGIYIIKITNGDNIFNRKFVKE